MNVFFEKVSLLTGLCRALTYHEGDYLKCLIQQLPSPGTPLSKA